jgi:hypothetical protein
MGGERKLLRGHYNPVNWTRKYPNVQYAQIDGKRMLICTACMRTRHKPAHVRKTAVAKAKIAA